LRRGLRRRVDESTSSVNSGDCVWSIRPCSRGLPMTSV
jgi:hypothetical protein